MMMMMMMIDDDDDDDDDDDVGVDVIDETYDIMMPCPSEETTTCCSPSPLLEAAQQVQNRMFDCENSPEELSFGLCFCVFNVTYIIHISYIYIIIYT